MKGVIALVLLTVCTTSSNRVRYTIKNILREPHFELTQTIWSVWYEPFMRTMEKAAENNMYFRFSADYYVKERGYVITAINGVRGVNGTYWKLLTAPNETIQEPVNHYFTRNGEHIIYNFTILDEK